MMNGNENAPSPEPANGQASPTASPTLMSLLALGRTVPFCSFDRRTEEGEQLLQKCEETPDASVRKMAGREFDLEHVYFRVVGFNDPHTGTVRPILRVCLIAADGEVYPCASQGIVDALVRFIGSKGMPPFDPPLRVRVGIQTRGQERERFQLLRVFDTKKGGKKK